MSRWFRFYSDAMRDPKVSALSDSDFRIWTELLAVAADNDGLIPPLADTSRILRRRLDKLINAVKRLTEVGLIDACEDGFEPHNWQKRQYKSDNSTERVKRFRAAQRNVAETASETAPETETETETENNPPSPPSLGKAGAGVEYAFFGKTIRLNQRDLDTWRKRYHAIGDIEAALGALDDWLQGQPTEKRGKWFHTVSGSLERKHQDALKETRTAESGYPQGHSGIPL